MAISKRTFIAGFLSGSIFFSGLSFAATADIVAKIADFKFKVNGESQTLSNKPVIIEGKTYLPVREVADMVGYNVDFSNGEVNLSNKKSISPSETVKEASESTAVNKEVKIVKDLESTYSVDGKLDLELIKTGISKGEITINSKDESTGDSLLIFCVRENNYPVYLYLKENSVDAEQPNNEGKTPLIIATIERSDFYMGELLINFKVDPYVKDNSGKMAIDYTDENSSYRRTLKVHM